MRAPAETAPVWLVSKRVKGIVGIWGVWFAGPDEPSMFVQRCCGRAHGYLLTVIRPLVLMLAALALICASLPAWAFYGTRAAGFPPGTYLTASISDTRYLPPESSQIVCSLWYNSTHPPTPGTSAVFFQAVNHRTLIFSLAIDAFRHKGSGIITYNLGLYLSNGESNPDHWAFWQSSNSFAYDGRWHNIAVTADTQTINSATKQFAAVGATVTLLQPGPATVLLLDAASDGSGQGFSTPWNGSFWTMGAQLATESGRAGNFFNGYLSQAFCYPGVSSYTDIMESNGLPRTNRVHSSVVEQNEFRLYVPSELGRNCTGPFGIPTLPADLYPVVCMTGGPNSFTDNQGGATRFTLSGNSPLPLQLSPTDPFGGELQ